MIRSRILVAGLLVAGLASVVVDSAQAAPPEAVVKAKIAKQPDGPFKDAVRLNLADGQAKNAYLKVKSLTGETEAAEMTSQEPNDLRVKFFKNNGDNITDEVLTGPGYTFNVKGDSPKRFRMRVKALDTGVDDCVNVDVKGDPPSDTSTVSAAINQPAGDCAP